MILRQGLNEFVVGVTFGEELAPFFICYFALYVGGNVAEHEGASGFPAVVGEEEFEVETDGLDLALVDLSPALSKGEGGVVTLNDFWKGGSGG